ncbi:MAG: hypothetical protein H6557_25265 [Lewinellaceae bacterium]|nr:hypothetical protein [Phaeodactylibacter sp.]MCB9039944.1 hypothetical protein [Lewinellaceae bacterium]
MGEFQCYKFKSIDRPLNESERREVDGLSSRGQVTSHSATFIYHYSDFRHNPETVLEKYFDAMLYFSNWGMKRLMFRLPAELINAKEVARYCHGDEYGSRSIELKRRSGCYLLDIEFSDEEGGGWMEEEDYELDDLAPLRDNILNGDYRALYLAWAHFSQLSEEEGPSESDVPPVPPNLRHLTAALKAFIDFFEIDEDLVAAAQSASPASRASEVDYEKLLLLLPEKERSEWLSRLLRGEPRLELLLKKRLEKLSPRQAGPAQPELSPAELRKLSVEKEQERKAREKAEAQASHVKRMKELAGQEADLWKGVVYNIERKTGTSYDLATESLKDLKALAAFQGKEAAFQAKMEELRQQYARRGALIKRWEEAGL